MSRMIKGFVWGVLIVLAVWFFYGCSRGSSGYTVPTWLPTPCPGCVKQTHIDLTGAPIKYWQTVDNKVQYY